MKTKRRPTRKEKKLVDQINKNLDKVTLPQKEQIVGAVSSVTSLLVTTPNYSMSDRITGLELTVQISEILCSSPDAKTVQEGLKTLMEKLEYSKEELVKAIKKSAITVDKMLIKIDWQSFIGTSVTILIIILLLVLTVLVAFITQGGGFFPLDLFSYDDIKDFVTPPKRNSYPPK